MTPSPGINERLRNPSTGSRKPILEPFTSRGKQPSEALRGFFGLTSAAGSKKQEPGEDGLVAEVSASVSIANRLLPTASGRSNLVSLTDWSDPTNPEFVKTLDLSGFFEESSDSFTTSAATVGNLTATAATPCDEDNPHNSSAHPASKVLFYSLAPTGERTHLDEVETAFLHDGRSDDKGVEPESVIVLQRGVAATPWAAWSAPPPETRPLLPLPLTPSTRVICWWSTMSPT